jgi:hypothetical protein
MDHDVSEGRLKYEYEEEMTRWKTNRLEYAKEME